MATINVIQATRGRITVSDETESHYTVTYTPMTQDSFFNGFKVYCHACGRYVFYGAVSDQTVSINFTALENDGHPGPFDISANEHDVEFLVETFAANPAMGTTSPVQKIYGVDVGSSVTFSISATANPGYKFVKWVDEINGTEYTTSGKTITVQINDETDNYRLYTAYFALEEYNYQVGPEYKVSADQVSGRTPDNFKYERNNVSGVERKCRLYYSGILRDSQGNIVYRGSNNFAYVHGMPYQYTQGQQIAVSLEITDQTLWDFLGLRLVGWRVIQARTSADGSYNYHSNEVFDDDGTKSLSFTADYIGDGRTSPTWYYVYAIICTSDVHKLEFDCVPPAAAELYLKGNAIEGRGVGKQVAMVPYGDTVNLEVMALLGVYAALGLIHGWSAQLSVAQNPIGAPIAAKEYIMPNANARIVVYICSHRLVCTDDGANLECKPPELLYDCSVPPGTTVYS